MVPVDVLMTKYSVVGAIIAFALAWYILKWSLMPTLLATAFGGIIAQVLATLLEKKREK
jgi:hypothetical protein